MVIKSGNMRWVDHVACMREMRNAYRISSENLMGRDHSENLDVGGKVVVEWVLWK
jgi:hypothetical protein